MVFYLILLLGISIVGMTVLISVKRYELASGRLVFAGARPTITKWSSRMVFLFGTAIPLYLTWQAERLYRKLTSWVHWLVAHGVVSLERWLESVLTTVREKTASTRAPGEASAFLREVAEHKKKLTSRQDLSEIEEL